MLFEELDYQQTELGELILRVRESPSRPGTAVYEVKLDGEFLMSSLVNESEIALADLALQQLGSGPLDVLIGGLGLGYTAAAALRYPAVRRVRVLEILQPVIDWHRRKLVPAAKQLLGDARCELAQGDFFKYVGIPADESSRYDAILQDIDHSPESLLHSRHGAFYTDRGISRLASHLRPGGIFAFWSADLPPETFIKKLDDHFEEVQIREIRFFAPHLHCHDTNWIVLATAGQSAI